MTRPLRIALASGLYHVTSRGDRREAIYRGDRDREQQGTDHGFFSEQQGEQQGTDHGFFSGATGDRPRFLLGTVDITILDE